jgi:acyl dehydratase
MSGPIETVPREGRLVTAFDIVMGAAASRDWQPQHHDADHARAMNLPGIIMNAPTQTGWFHAVVMSWAGREARIRRWKLRMLRPVCAGMRVELGGAVTGRQPAAPGLEWCWIDLSMEDRGEVLSTMRLVLIRSTESAGTLPDTEWKLIVPDLALQSRNR